jgi:hypothetical protein
MIITIIIITYSSVLYWNKFTAEGFMKFSRLELFKFRYHGLLRPFLSYELSRIHKLFF